MNKYNEILKEIYGSDIIERDLTRWEFIKEGCECYPHTIKPKVLKRIDKYLNGHKEKKFVFITIQDFRRRLCDLEKMQAFIKRIAYMYNAGFWIIEAGKSDPPNVHIHLLVQIKNSKKHKCSLNAKWMGLFDTNLQGDNDYYKLCTHNDSPDMPSYQDWYKEKMIYFENDKKGDHANSIDLDLKGGQGCPGGFLLPYSNPHQ